MHPNEIILCIICRARKTGIEGRWERESARMNTAYHGVVFSVPIDACLSHEHGNVPLQLIVISGEWMS